MVFIESGPKLDIGQCRRLHLFYNLFLLILDPQFADQVQKFDIRFFTHFLVNLFLEDVVLVIFFLIEGLELHLQQGFQSHFLFTLLIQKYRIFQLQFVADRRLLIPKRIYFFDDIFATKQLFIFFLQLSILEHLEFVFGEGSPGRTSFNIAFMSVHFHVALNGNVEHILVSPTQVATESRVVADHDLGSRPLIDVLNLELQRVSICLRDRSRHETGQETE